MLPSNPSFPKLPDVLPVVLVSGASTGIGYTSAVRLAEAGFCVLAGYRQTADGDALRQTHATIVPVRLDITEAGSIQALGDFLQRQLGGRGLFGLVNNAGMAVGGPLEWLDVAQLRLQLEVNLVGHVALTQACLPYLRQARGRVVNMGSVAGLVALPFAAPYSMSKFALEAFSDALRIEVQPWGIDVSIIEPGAIATPIWNKSLSAAETMAMQQPGEQMALYEEALQCVQRATQRSAERGLPASLVAEAVHHALTAKRPRTRYLIGKDAQLRKVLRWLPDAWKDWLITQKASLPARNSQTVGSPVAAVLNSF